MKKKDQNQSNLSVGKTYNIKQQKEEKMKTAVASSTIGLILMFLGVANVAAHCEIPCGIYDDALRSNLIYEHTTTIEKSMKKIVQLSQQNPVNYNQLVRWIANKEEHATKFMDIVQQYFLNQRIKPVDDSASIKYDDYIKQLKFMHGMLVTAMKCKQTVDKLNTAKLSGLVAKSKELYFKEQGH